MLSSVAGVIDKEGHFRVVVTQRWRMRYHISDGELLFVVPGLKVKEPVALGNVHYLVCRAQECVEEWFRSRNDPEWEVWRENYESRHDRRRISA